MTGRSNPISLLIWAYAGEYFGPLYEKHNNIDVAVPGTGVDTLTGTAVRIGGDLYNASYHNFGPQIGFAWSPHSLPLLQQDLIII